MQCHATLPYPKLSSSFLKPEGCNLLLLGFIIITATMHVVQIWLLSSQPHPLIMQREPAPPYYYAERTSGRVVRTNPTNFLWIRPCNITICHFFKSNNLLCEGYPCCKRSAMAARGAD